MNETTLSEATIKKKTFWLVLFGLVCLTAMPCVAHARYRDGMNLYEYVQSAPTKYVDPSGTTVVITCKARDKVQSGLHDVTVSGYDLKQGANLDVYRGSKTQFRMDGSYSEIVGSMIKSKRVFTIKGDTAEDAIENWKLHVDARRHIIDAAKVKQFGFLIGPIRSNTDFWVHGELRMEGKLLGYWDYAKNPKDAFSAIGDIWDNPDKYGMACFAGTAIVMLRGLSLAMGADEFNKAAPKYLYHDAVSMLRQDYGMDNDDWIPGDWGYVKNTRFSGTLGREGKILSIWVTKVGGAILRRSRCSNLLRVQVAGTKW